MAPKDAYAAHMWPAGLIAGTDAALDSFDGAMTILDVSNDAAVFDAIRTVVLNLNRVHEGNPDPGFETGERERLCEYIEISLEEAGVDVDGLAARRSITRHEITDDWRRW